MFYDPRKTAYFKDILNTVAGQALEAANYQLQNEPLHHARGLLRYQKQLRDAGDNIYGFIEWQLLAFEQNPFARFQVRLLRNQGIDARATTTYQNRVEQTLPWVIWNHYEVQILPNDSYWWEFRHGDELPHALAHAGKLLFGYGIPWLEMHED